MYALILPCRVFGTENNIKGNGEQMAHVSHKQ